jgi:hypothetical protein
VRTTLNELRIAYTGNIRGPGRVADSGSSTTAGGIITTNYVGVPTSWTVEQAPDLIRRAGAATRPVYAVYVIDPVDDRLVHVVSLRELVIAAPAARVIDVRTRREDMSRRPGVLATGEGDPQPTEGVPLERDRRRDLLELDRRV